MLRMMLLLVIAMPAWALTEARLLNQSTSGQTVVFNLGIHDGIKDGDYAVIVKQIRSLESRDLRLIPAAKARNVKINSDSSVWMLYHIYDHELLVKGDKFLVLSETHMLSGRRSPKMGRITVVTNKKRTSEEAKYAVENDKDRLSKLKDNYQTMTPAHETSVGSDMDAELIDLESWEKNNSSRYRTSLYRSAHKDEWRRQLRLSTFEKLVTAYLKRVNDPDFNYDKFYDTQKRRDWSSEYGKFLRAQAKRTDADAKLFRSVLEKGESWSEDYSDEELRKTLNQVSVLQEKDRREYVMAKPTRFAASLDYGFLLSDAQSDKDPYQRESRYAVESDFEVTPFLKHETLERFTLNAGFRLNYSAFEAEDFNADLNEYSVSLGANWYPLYAPYTQMAPILFLGTYIRSGFAKAVAPTAREKANYTVLSMPGLRAGFKYYLRNNLGIRLILSMETLKIERYEASKLNSILPERTNLVEGKMGVGLAYAF